MPNRVILKILMTASVLCLSLVIWRAHAAPEAGDAAAAIDAPDPALMAARAAKSLLLDVADTGAGYVAVGAYGDILVAGRDEAWKQVESPVSVMLNRVRFVDAQHGWCVGHDGTILGTTDGGLHWTLQFRDAAWGKPFYGLYFLDAAHGIAVGSSGRAVETFDGGSHWKDMEGPLFKLGWNLNAIERLADGSLMIAGERGLLARSSDQGKTWQQLSSPYNGSYYGILPYRDHGAAVYGMRGHVFVADDVRALQTVDSTTWDPDELQSVTDPAVLAKMGWRQLQSPVNQGLYGGLIRGGSQALFVGVSGIVLQGDLAGAGLSQLPHAGAPLSAAVLRDRRLLTVGRDGIGSIALQE